MNIVDKLERYHIILDTCQRKNIVYAMAIQNVKNHLSRTKIMMRMKLNESSGIKVIMNYVPGLHR